MSIEIKSPTFPESVADGTIANWVKKEGESVKQDEDSAQIETDKVELEVVAPFDGIISKVLKPAGEIVLSAELIAEFEEGGHPESDIQSPADDLPAPSHEIKTDTTKSNEIQSKTNGPAVKKLLKEHELDENSIDGSGKDGRITKADIVNHLEEFSKDSQIKQSINAPSPAPISHPVIETCLLYTSPSPRD